jgi:osmotically-inducible protein OsmY
MRRAVTVFAAALLLAAVCWPTQAQSAQAKSQSKAAPKWKDAELKKTVEERLARSAIAVDHFKVEVSDGVVILTGKTDILQHKGVATRLARAVGAKEVRNQIEVSEAARQKAAARLAKGRAAK